MFLSGFTFLGSHLELKIILSNPCGVSVSSTCCNADWFLCIFNFFWFVCACGAGVKLKGLGYTLLLWEPSPPTGIAAQTFGLQRGRLLGHNLLSMSDWFSRLRLKREEDFPSPRNPLDFAHFYASQMVLLKASQRGMSDSSPKQMRCDEVLARLRLGKE